MKRVRKKKHGGARSGAGRKPVDRRIVSARVDNALYDTLSQRAKTKDIKLSTLIEQLLTSSEIHLPKELTDQLVVAAKAAHVSQSVYVMQVLQAHFQAQGAT
jgi:predicted HicB family RNase H-like nuclease